MSNFGGFALKSLHVSQGWRAADCRISILTLVERCLRSQGAQSYPVFQGRTHSGDQALDVVAPLDVVHHATIVAIEHRLEDPILQGIGHFG